MKLELLSDDSNRFIQALIDYDINSKDKYGSNLLHYYIMNYKSIVHPAGVIIPEFVKKGLDINEKRKDGRTALYLSVQYQLKGIFELLLNHNADIDMQNANGNTPLWEAVMPFILLFFLGKQRKQDILHELQQFGAVLYNFQWVETV